MNKTYNMERAWVQNKPLLFSKCMSPDSLQKLLLVGSCSVKLWFSASAHLSNFWDSDLPCDLTSLTDLRRVVNFQLFSFLFVVRVEW